MTNAEQPEDINTRLNTIDEQLEQLADEIDLIRTIQTANRREVRATSQTTARLERSITRLEEIARLHQQGLRIAQQEAERDRQIFQAEIMRIWEYLRDRNGGTPTP